MAIKQALALIRDDPGFSSQDGPIEIMTDSQTVLRSLRKPAQQSGQFILRDIIRIIVEITENGKRVHLRWVPAHEGIVGNERAHKEAHRATEPEAARLLQRTGSVRLKSAAIRCGREKLMKERTEQFRLEGKTGQFTRGIDGALPQKHTTKLYNTLSADEASILAQLRTGHNRLKSYLFRFSLADDDQCECGAAADTVRHLLFACEKWQAERAPLRQKLQQRWGDLSYMLGGWNPWVDRNTGKTLDGKQELWRPNISIVKAVIEFVRTTGRFSTKRVIEELRTQDG
jgi:hypothetical protein